MNLTKKINITCVLFIKNGFLLLLFSIFFDLFLGKHATPMTKNKKGEKVFEIVFIPSMKLNQKILFELNIISLINDKPKINPK